MLAMPAATVTLGLAIFNCFFVANLDDGTSLFAINRIFLYSVRFCGLLAVVGSVIIAEDTGSSQSDI